MKRLFMLVLFCLPTILYAQSDISSNGIKWAQGLTWEQVKERAKAENKYIFVDCYATWCVPCRKMDADVYPNDSVGAFVNEKFISIKVQLDSTKNDNTEIKSWYDVAHNFATRYTISSLPTFLFFSPEGEIVHKELGSKTVKEFISIAENALDQNKQMYTAVRKYKENQLDFPSVKNLIASLRAHEDEKLSLEIARNYMLSHLNKLPLKEFIAKENLDFMMEYSDMWTTGDRVFTLFYNNPGLIDSIMKDKGTAKLYVYWLVFKENLVPKLDAAKQSGNAPDWETDLRSIKRKYPKINALELMAKAKVKWYKYKQDWNNYSKYLVQQIEMNGVEKFSLDMNGVMALNGSAWEIFLHSNNKKYLQKAIGWVNRALMADSQSNMVVTAVMDTKANLIYKLGRKQEAIQLYREIVKQAPTFIKTLEKMEKGLPTWN